MKPSRPLLFVVSAMVSGAVAMSSWPAAVRSATFEPTTLDQAAVVSGTGSASARSVAVDGAGNRYVVGTTSGEATFASALDLESGVSLGSGSLGNSTTNGSEMFLAKYSDGGSLVWVVTIASDFWVQGFAVDVNAVGDVAVTGRFLGTAVLASATSASTGSAVDQATLSVVSRSAGGASTALGETFVARYSSAGVVLWASPASNGDQYNEATGVALDGAGNVFVTGHMWTAGASAAQFRSATSAQTGTVVDAKTLTLPISTYLDVFLAKYDSSGSLQWVSTASTWAEDLSYSVDVGSDGHPVIAGTFALANLSMPSARRPSDGNPVPDNGTLVSNVSMSLPIGGFRDCFVAKYRSDGTLLWALRIGAANEERCKSVDVGPDDRVRTAGVFAGSITVPSATDPATNTAVSADQITVQSQGGLDLFVASYSATGVLEWVATGGSTLNEDAWSMIGTPGGGIALAAQLTGASTLSSAKAASTGMPVDAASTTIDAATGSYGTAVARFAVDGALTWMTGVRSSTHVALVDIAVDDRDRLHAAGEFRGTLAPPTGVPMVDVTVANSSSLLINWGRTRLPPIIFVPPPTTTPTTTAAPEPTLPVPSVGSNGELPNVPPGSGVVIEAGVEFAVETFVENRTDLVMRSQNFELRVKGECSGGCAITTTAEGREVISLAVDGRANVTGFGFEPGTSVYVWLFSDPRFLGELLVAADGTFDGQVDLGGIPVGRHTLQVTGTSADGVDRAANLGVIVGPVSFALPVTGSDDSALPWMLTLLVAGLLLTYQTRANRCSGEDFSPHR